MGLVSGARLADFGHHVTCVDNDAAKIEALRGGAIPIFEPGLDVLVASNAKAGRLSFTTDLAAAVARRRRGLHRGRHAVRRGDGHADLSLRLRRRRARSPARLRGYTVVVTKSTVPVGTGDEVERHHRASCQSEALDFDVASNPGVPARRLGDRGLHAAGPRRRRHRGRARRRELMREIYRPLYLNADAAAVHRDRAPPS
ncbi:MAG: hypothetical protein MZV49_22115 [Rhodopseudomonas palustris]|nr:hypothetical protein [Rhodopseudomonas palustris]